MRSRFSPIATPALLVGLVYLTIGAYFINYEMTPGMNHTMHPCHVTSMFAVLSTFIGVVVSIWAVALFFEEY